MQNSLICWRDLSKLGSRSSLISDWFSDVVKKRLGAGDSVRFWNDVWTENDSLKDLFLLYLCFPQRKI